MNLASRVIVQNSPAGPLYTLPDLKFPDPNRSTGARPTARQYRAFADSLSPEDRAFAIEHNLHKPMPDGGFRQPNSEDAMEDTAREPIPKGELRGKHNSRDLIAAHHPIIDQIEPENTSADVENLSQDEVREASETFGNALRWALEADGLVKMGERSLIIISAMRPDIPRGVTIDRALGKQFTTKFRVLCSDGMDRMRETGRIFGCFLEWMCRGRVIESLGERLQLVAYELRPDLIGAKTLAELGEELGKTRQAKDKGANCLRDTFAGLKAICQRDTVTRLRCQIAQLA